MAPLTNHRILITGASRGLGAALSVAFAKEGCDVAINYLSSKDAAEEVARKVRAEGRKAVVIQGDAGVKKDCTRMVEETVTGLGGVEGVVANAGWTKFTTFGDINSMNEEEWDKCWAANTKSPLHLLQAATPYFKENPDGGQLILTSSVAGTAPGGSSMAYSVTKAAGILPFPSGPHPSCVHALKLILVAGLHLVQCLAQTQGPKVRVNAVCPGIMLTDWGMQFSEEKLKGFIEGSALKREVSFRDRSIG
ncbi:hypothetical protein MMC10_000320 [Thelotrema lepadinum]|nr:hypothetical protein [Thelotrema lepadinum]